MLDIVTGDRGEYRDDAAGAERLIDKLDSSPINCQGIIFIVKLNGNTLKTQNYYGRGNALRYEIHDLTYIPYKGCKNQEKQ